MAKKDKKQRHKKKREQARKRQKAKLQSLPKLLRKDPVLNEALNFRYPLVECLINKDWYKHKFANVYLIRKAPSGLVFSSFLVDIIGVGLKDAAGDCGRTAMDIEEIKKRSAAHDNTLIPCDLELINDLVYGGMIWAKKWKFKLPKDYAIWLRLLEPVDRNAIKLDRFGENGKPVIFLDEDELDREIEKKFDPRILKQKLKTDDVGMTSETLDLIGDIKAGLIAFSRRVEFKQDFDGAYIRQFGENQEPKSEYEWIDFQDRFIIENELEDGNTVLQRFIEDHQGKLSDDVHHLLLDWQNVIEGMFEVKGIEAGKFNMRNLINEREYSVYATATMDTTDLEAGDFVITRIVPAVNFHIFTGAFAITRTDGSLQQRAEMYKTAVEFQMKHPNHAFKDNEEKLQKSRQEVRNQYEDFMNHFGTDEVFGSGREVLQHYQAFFDYQVFDKVNPDTGLTAAAFYKQDTGEAYTPPPIAQLPDNVRESRDVAMLCDPEEGLSFLIQYRRFLDIFENFDPHLGHYQADDLVMEYLESDTVTDIPFRKAAKRFPENFKAVMEYLGEQEGFEAVEIDDLMREFKPHTFSKLPTTVAILDSEMIHLAKLADSKPKFDSGR